LVEVLGDIDFGKISVKVKREKSMKSVLYASAAALALTAQAASAEQITVFGPFIGPDQESLEAVLSVFAEETGHDVRYTGSDSFEQQIMIDAEAGSAPNLAIFPQPGLASDMAARGFLTPLKEGTADWVRENYAAGQSWVDLGTYADAAGAAQMFGFFYKVDVKARVW
jgi:alpha-glucoside transport system substrate-binding protein